MESIFTQANPWFIASLLAMTMLAGWAVGWWIGRKSPADDDNKSAARFVDGNIALLGLLLGFTFAMALNKHEQRRLIVIADSNSIGDYYTCATMLPDPQRTKLQATIHDYLNLRLQVFRGQFNIAGIAQAIKDSELLQQRMTSLTSEAINVGTPVGVPLLNALNNLTSNHASLIAAMHDRLSPEVLLLLSATAICSTILVGRHHGRHNRLYIAGTLSYVLLISLSVSVILDLNQPAKGMITVSTESFERLAQSMAK